MALTLVIVLVVVAIAVALIGLIVYLLKGMSQNASRAIDERSPASTPRRPMPTVSSFHVKGDTASVVFSVPLGDAEAGSHLTDLLAANAVEIVRNKVASGLPLEGIHTIAVSAMRGDNPELLTTIDLPSVGELPAVSPLLARDSVVHDPIAALEAVASDRSITPPSREGESLEPVGQLIELSSPSEAHLRALGVDPGSASLRDLVTGLVTVAGYDIDAGRRPPTTTRIPSGDIHWISRAGDTAILAIVEHEHGSYPEIDDAVLGEFAAVVAQTNPKSGILVTDKFSPYSMYDRERRDKRLVFVTRERLQGFVDTFGLD